MLGQENESGMSDEQRMQLTMQLQQIVQGQKVQMKILGQCFDKCVNTLGTELSDSDQRCIYQCTSRIFETESFLGNRMNAMIQAQGGGH